MARRSVGPRRSDSLPTYVRSTRIIGGLSVLVLSGAVAWDLANDGSWSRHALFTSLVASLIVVAVTVAVLNELLERRQRQRWSVLAQYALFEFVHTARLVWTVKGFKITVSPRKQVIRGLSQSFLKPFSHPAVGRPQRVRIRSEDAGGRCVDTKRESVRQRRNRKHRVGFENSAALFDLGICSGFELMNPRFSGTCSRSLPSARSMCGHLHVPPGRRRWPRLAAT
jgi:hypothetical protein